MKMDDNDVCPLCCEELDMSDRQFFPCKCGYQVCMWCWHRIRESESGLCPACRTPYGDDPHEFSAVDMEEVVKANKEKAAAEKRERERLKQQQPNQSSSCSVGSSSSLQDGESGSLGGVAGRQVDPPKDRNQLANMRVIRRNLVYAVGLPPSIATEETLRKPEYFGQYGKISKIVLNRNHNGNGDPRRASASAYVTFAHKEDTLACILALDGFYLDGRNIRASYGTSKYCSAFIKNVRCNNPDCTYLHCMGDPEDTFTKQEIQAGYVTSGRDVLARQQQQMQAQQQNSSGPSTRRRVGGGGPSASGRVPANPVFPPPCFDEPAKPERSSSAVSSFGVSHATTSRSTSVGSTPTGFSSVAAAGVSTPPAPTQTKVGRSSSISLPATAQPEKVARPQQPPQPRHPQTKPTPKKSSPTTTAASIVASGTTSTITQSVQPPPHTTLTPLTPLKRSSSLPAPSKEKLIVSKPKSNRPTPPASPAPPEPKESRILNQQPVPKNLVRHQSVPVGGAPVGTAVGSKTLAPGSGFIGGSIIGGNVGPVGSPPSAVGAPFGGLHGLSVGGSVGSIGNNLNPSLGSIGGGGALGHIGSKEGSLIGCLGGDQLRSNGSNHLYPGGQTEQLNGPFRKTDKWGDNDSLSSSSYGSGGLFGTGSFGGSGSFGLSTGGIWGNDSSPTAAAAPPNVGANAFLGFNDRPNNVRMAVGESAHHYTNSTPAVGGPILNKNPFSAESGSSALASMLGIDLPTGSGSLRECNASNNSPLPPPPPTQAQCQNFSSGPFSNNPRQESLWPSSQNVDLNRTIQTTPVRNIPQGPIGTGPNRAPVGGVTISGGNRPSSTNSDIALLQSLLPGVHITSGNAHQPAAPVNNIGGTWANSPAPQQNHGMRNAVNNEQAGNGEGGDTWGGVGLFGGRGNVQHPGMSSQSSIW